MLRTCSFQRCVVCVHCCTYMHIMYMHIHTYAYTCLRMFSAICICVHEGTHTFVYACASCTHTYVPSRPCTLMKVGTVMVFMYSHKLLHLSCRDVITAG